MSQIVEVEVEIVLERVLAVLDALQSVEVSPSDLAVVVGVLLCEQKHEDVACVPMMHKLIAHVSAGWQLANANPQFAAKPGCKPD